MPKVSIILPIYKVEKYLRQCLDSIITQTLGDIEIICVDDGSPDNSGVIVDEYASKDSRIKAIHQENGGYGKAVNTGLNVATGEYIGIVEPDDYIELDMYEKLYSKSKESDADVCTSGFYTYNSQLKKKYQNKKWKNDKENIENFPNDKAFKITDYPSLFMMHASVWAKIYKFDFLKHHNIKMNETKSASYQDFPFMAEVMCKAERIAVVSEYFYHWRLETNQGSSTTSGNSRLLFMPDQCEEVKRIVKENGLYDDLKEAMYRHFCVANSSFFFKIQWDLKREYFEKMRRLFAELSEDENFEYKYFSKKEIKFIKNILNNKFFASIPFKVFRKSFIRIRFNNKEKMLSIFGKKIIEVV